MKYEPYSQIMLKEIFFATVCGLSLSTIATAQQLPLTLEKIMADPSWLGHAPTYPQWGLDSQRIIYFQKNEKQLDDLYQVVNGKSSLVPLKDYAYIQQESRRSNQKKTAWVWSHDGDIYFQNQHGIKQITRTNYEESSPQILIDGRVAYRSGLDWFAYDPKSGLTEQLAMITFDESNKHKATDSYLAKEQHRLIQYVQKQQARQEAAKANREKRYQAIHYATNEFHLGYDNTIVDAALSPDGKWLLAAIAKEAYETDRDDYMPTFVTESGRMEQVPIRTRVAEFKPYDHQLVLLDLINGKQHTLSYKGLTNYDKDVLQSIREENKIEQEKENKRYIQVKMLSAPAPIQWHSTGKQVAVMLGAVDHKDRWIVTVDLQNKQLVEQHHQHDPAWINTYHFNEFGWHAKKEVLYYLSEESGYGHLYTKGIQSRAKQWTEGEYEVSRVTMTQHGDAFFLANKEHPGHHDVYRMNFDSGELKRVTHLGGRNTYHLSPDEQSLLIEHSSMTRPPELYRQSIKTGKVEQLTKTTSQAYLAYPWQTPQVIEIPSSYQDKPVYARFYRPKNAENVKKRKAVIFVHGAGYLQNAHFGWSGYFREYMFHQMLAEQGYVVLDVDYRASAGYGRDWRTAIYRQMGKPEVEDLKDSVQWLIEHANVDPKRVGVYGGSYGGFLTFMALFTEPELFQAGAALRPVTDWAHYNWGYTSPILNTPQVDPMAYRRSSPIYHAEGLNKPLLICAPMVDDNVLFQDSVRLVQRLIELKKENFETAIYPVEPHGFRQPTSWLDEYRRIYKLFEKNL
ncbi:S9 family peptidase [Algicola sagamiensis]|uniref:S9 family peptidase n=1 Tax=Algicola sagamiensis TaxID=163869 RepID=UPI0009FD05E0|nr:prolyl oligopeptidase family serine peptidase [Algicola sagamiensis]